MLLPGGLLLLLAISCTTRPLSQQGVRNARFTFALIGDAPYTPKAVSNSFPNLIADLNRTRLSFVVHDGDIKSGASPCTDEVFFEIHRQFQTIEHPLIYVFGDNEWTDCDQTKEGQTDPEERLAKLREIFTQGDHSLGRHPLRLDRQSRTPGFREFRENVRWSFGNVLFVGLNITGSDNHFGAPEFERRNEANLAWTHDSFEMATRNRNRAIMLIIQANPLFEKPREQRKGFNGFLELLERETLAFKRPVVLVHGDTHYFRVDKPMIGSKSKRRVENFTRVETFGNPDVHWLHVTVDWRDPAVFTFRQRLVEGNLVH